MAGEFVISGESDSALFTLKIYRGDGMALLAMNWRDGQPPEDFVGFAIGYKEPGGDRYYLLKNRLAFPTPEGAVNPTTLETNLSPIQMFRWVHFPRNADLPGEFQYQVTPVFMNALDELSYGDPQEAAVELQRETYPGKLNVAFTRGFVSSQAFVDRYQSAGDISELLPATADEGLTFTPTHPKAAEALAWMGFEARSAILAVLDQALADQNAQVRVIAYDLNEPEVVVRLEQLGARLKVIIDNSGDHGGPASAETAAAARLAVSAGTDNVKRQKMKRLQHNKTIVVDGTTTKTVVCGSTNLSWRGFFVQSNHAVVLQGSSAVARFLSAFEGYWETPATFGDTAAATWHGLGLSGIDARVAFSPHSPSNELLATIADDIEQNTTSSLFYSLAFLYQTPGPIQDAIKSVSERTDRFSYGISDRKVGGLDLQNPDGNVSPVYPSQLTGDVPPPFKQEPTGGGGIRMHHKFVVIDFDKPTARVYLGSYNFSNPADTQNGENLLLIRNRRIAVSFMVEALRIFDHYSFRLAQKSAPSKKPLALARPPRTAGDKPWWDRHYTNPHKIRDRELFS